MLTRIAAEEEARTSREIRAAIDPPRWPIDLDARSRLPARPALRAAGRRSSCSIARRSASSTSWTSSSRPGPGTSTVRDLRLRLPDREPARLRLRAARLAPAGTVLSRPAAHRRTLHRARRSRSARYGPADIRRRGLCDERVPARGAARDRHRRAAPSRRRRRRPPAESAAQQEPKKAPPPEAGQDLPARRRPGSRVSLNGKPFGG